MPPKDDCTTCGTPTLEVKSHHVATYIERKYERLPLDAPAVKLRTNGLKLPSKRIRLPLYLLDYNSRHGYLVIREDGQSIHPEIAKWLIGYSVLKNKVSIDE